MDKDGVVRSYRKMHVAKGLVFFRVNVAQSDLSIGAKDRLEEPARTALKQVRKMVEDEILLRPEFMTALQPLSIRNGCPQPVADMYLAAMAAGVGPMAAVAGAVAQYVGRVLLEYSDEVIVENGGDLFIHNTQPRLAAVYAGSSRLSGKLAISLQPGSWGMCTSAGTLGPSLSMGSADAACVLSRDTALSDAAATALGNSIRSGQDLEKAVLRILKIKGILGALAIIADDVAAAGEITLQAIAPNHP